MKYLVLLLLMVSCSKKVVENPVNLDTSDIVTEALKPVELPRENFKFKKCVYFDFDSYGLKGSQLIQVMAMDTFIQQHPDNEYILAGHCDIRGSDAYNYELGLKRAEAVRLALGLNIRVISYGENKPAAECYGDNDLCHMQNRRVELIIK